MAQLGQGGGHGPRRRVSEAVRLDVVRVEEAASHRVLQLVGRDEQCTQALNGETLTLKSATFSCSLSSSSMMSE